MKRLMAAAFALIMLMVSFYVVAEDSTVWKCPNCGREGNTKNFCPGCGSPRPEQQDDALWDCPVCGFEGNPGKFCQECGSPKPVIDDGLWDCPTCGFQKNPGKFCQECGAKKPDSSSASGPLNSQMLNQYDASATWDDLIEGRDYIILGNTLVLITPMPIQFKQQYIERVDELIRELEADLGFKNPQMVIYDSTLLNHYDLYEPTTQENAERVNRTIQEQQLLKDFGYNHADYNDYASMVTENSDDNVYIYLFDEPEVPGAVDDADKSSGVENIPESVPNDNQTDASDDGTTAVTTFITSNVRSGPGSSYDLLGSVNAGTKLNSYRTVNSSDGTGQWYEIEYNGKKAYISTTTASEGNHVHTPATRPSVAATCTTAGKTQGTYCSQCGATIKAQTTIPATGHTAVTRQGTAATCTTAGKSDGSYCSKCGVTLKAQTTIAALGHNLTHVEAKAPTKTTPGWYAYDKCSRCTYSTYKARTLKPGNWSSWSTTAATETPTRDVETKVEQETVYVTQYNYNRYKYWNTTYNKYYYSYANVGGGEWQYKSTTTPLSIIRYMDGRPEYEGIWWNQSTSTVANGTRSVTYYRYRDYTE